MNKDNPLNTLVRIVEHIVDVLAGILVALFDGIKNAVDHANPSLFALVATLLPFALPLPVAFMTAHSARTFFGWDPWAANVLGFGLEGLGLLAWVKLVDAVLEQVRSKNEKIANVVLMYAAVALVYELLLVFLNVVLAWKDGADWQYIIVLVCVCLLPALSAMLYGYQKREVEHQLEAEKLSKLEEAERIRQERRADRKEAAELKLKYAKEAEALKLKDKPFRK
jgi:hypothetical protein